MRAQSTHIHYQGHDHIMRSYNTCQMYLAVNQILIKNRVGQITWLWCEKDINNKFMNGINKSVLSMGLDLSKLLHI